MKKETKKRVINGVLGTTIAAAAVTPISIVLSQKPHNIINENGDVSTFGVENSGYGLFSGGYTKVGTHKPDGSTAEINKNVASWTPNSFTAIPGGYVYSSNSYIYCVDENEPRLIKWYATVAGRVLSVMYNPVIEGIVVLHAEGSNTANTGATAWVSTYKNIIGISDGSQLTPTYERDIVTYTYGGDAYRYDTFGISPIYFYNGPSTEYIIWRKASNKASDSWFKTMWTYDVATNTRNRKNIDFSGNSDQMAAILSIGAIRYGANISLNLLMLRKGSTGTWLQNEYIVVDNQTTDTYWKKGVKNVVNTGWSDLLSVSQNLRLSFIAGSINTPGMWGNSSGEVVMTFALNIGMPSIQLSVHKTPMLVRSNLNIFSPNETLKSSTYVNLYTDTTNYSTNSAELWTGYFNNAPIAKNGVAFTSGKVGSPFIGIGWKNEDGINNSFVSVIKDTTRSVSSGYYDVTSSNSYESVSYQRVYLLGSSSQALTSSSKYYLLTQPSTTSNYDGGYYDQQKRGLPIMNYDDSATALTNPFSQNILLTSNDTNIAIVINQNSRGKEINNAATYGWYTHFENTTVTTTDPAETEKPVSEVTLDYINTTRNIEASPFWNSSFLTEELKLKNALDNSIFAIKPDTFRIGIHGEETDPDKYGYVTFDVYATTRYTDTGIYKGTDNLTNLKNNWWATHKVATVRINGFKWVPLTVLTSSPYKITTTTTNGVVSQTLIPIIIKNQQNSQGFKDFKELIWRSICSNGGAQGERLFANLIKEPEFNSDTWASDWNNFFASFSISNIDSENGIISVSLTVKSEYALGSTPGDVSFSVSFSGFKKVADTTFVNNTSDTAFSVEGTDLANKNIPYIDANTYQQPSYVNSDSTVATEQEIKEFLLNNYIKTAYNNATLDNSYLAENEWVKGVYYTTKLTNQSGKTSEQLQVNQLTINNIYLSNWNYYPEKGMLSVDVRLNIWYNSSNSGNGNYGYCWSKSATVDNQWGTEPDTNAPYGRWYISGFRNDNVTTSFDEEAVYDLSNIQWGGYNISEMIASKSYADSSTRTIVRKAILEVALANGYLKLPYWVNSNSLLTVESGYGELNLVELVSSDNNEGSAVYKIHLKRNNWIAQENGSVANNGYTSTPTTWTIKTIGFKKIKSVELDTSKIFEISGNELSNVIYFSPNKTNGDFTSWLTNVNTKIVEFVHAEDVKTNGVGARSLEQWKQTLQLKYHINTPSGETSFTIDTLKTEISSLIDQSKGKLNYFFSNSKNLSDGIKIWVELVDTGENFDSTIEGHPTNSTTGQSLSGLINTDSVITNIDMRAWFNVLSKNRGTAVEGVDEINNTVQSIVPPTLSSDSNSPGSGMTYIEIVSLLKKVGYEFEYSWTDAEGQKYVQNEFPIDFSYNPANPRIDVRIYYSESNVIPNIYIFGDSTFAQNEYSTHFSLGVKKVISISLSTFSMMYENFSAKDKNIEIAPSGDYVDVALMREIITAWEGFESYVWDQLSSGDSALEEEYKSILKISYSVNNSDFTYTKDSLWEAIVTGWKQAVSDINQISKLRFYSPSFANGTKIKATISFKEPQVAEENYQIKYKDGSEAIVNHGLGTTFDMSKYAQKWQSEKTNAAEGSTADNLLGFTPPSTPNNVVFSDFKQKASQELGMLFQFSGDNQSWFDLESMIKKVNQNDPAVYMRLSSNNPDALQWSNEFEIKNFATGVTNSESTDDNIKYSSGIKMPLNLPKYLILESSWVEEFVNESKSAWSGNTKKISIDNSIMTSAIDKLIDKIIKTNQVSLSKSDFKVEFKVDANEPTKDSGSTFAQYTSSFTSSIENGDYWNAFKNGVYVRVVLNTTDGAASYDEIKTSFNSENKEYALNVTPFKYFDDTSTTNEFDPTINPLKFWTPSAEELVQTIKVNGTTIQNISFTYPQPIYVDPTTGNVYTDETKRLSIQFSVRNVTSYDDPNAEWTLTPPTEISVDKWLFVRVVPNYNNIAYGPQEDSTAKAWQLDTKEIKPVIEANIAKLASMIISGSLNIGATNNFDTSIIKVEEQRIISEAIAIESVRNKVEVIYNLRTSSSDANTNWLTLDELLDKLQKDVQNYSNNVFGIASFISGQYSLKITLRSTDPDFNIIDKESQTYEPVSNGVTINTENIITKIDLTEWINFLEATKALVVTRTRLSSYERALVELTDKMIQPKPMSGQIGEGFLFGRSFKEITNLLTNTFGIRFQFSTNESDWVDDISSIKNFDDSVNKVWMRIYPSNFAPQIEISNNGSAINSIKTIVMNIQYPKSLTIKDSWVNEYINSLPVSGNTKYLEIDQSKENELIQKIIDANPPVSGDPTPSIWVEYSLGSTGWLNREKFIEALKNTNKDQTTNEIKIRLAVDPIDVDEPIYTIDQKEYILNNHNISSLSNVLIFVNENYEIKASNVSVSGADDLFTYSYGELPCSSEGNWLGAPGVRIQWTTDSNAKYDDDLLNPIWDNTQISKMDPVERYLAIRIVANDGYVYSATYSNPAINVEPNPKAEIHPVNTENIKSKLVVDLDKLHSELVFEGYSNDLNVSKLTQSEQTILNSIDGGDKLSIVYKVVLNNGQELSTKWLYADELQLELEKYSTNYNTPTQGLIKFSANGIEGAKIVATFISKDDKFSPVDPDANVEEGIQTQTDKVKTKIDLSKWYESLATNSTTFDSSSSSSNISGITPPGLPGNKGESFLSGLTYNEIMEILNKMGLKAEFKAPGSSTQDQWVSLDQITNLNNANELFFRINIQNQEWKETVEVIGLNGPQDFDSPEEVKLVIKLPITIVVDKNYLLELKFQGTTIDVQNFDQLKVKEAEIIDKVRQDNKTGVPETDAEIDAADISVRYSLGGLVIDTATSQDKVWLTLEEIKTALSTSKINYGTNEVKAKFVITNNTSIDENGTLKYQLSDEEPININEKELSDDAVFKIYVHNVAATTPSWMFDNLKVVGSQDSYHIENYETWRSQIPAGLIPEFNAKSINGEPDPEGWTLDPFATPISATKEYWVRFKIQPGYVFENPSASDPKLTDPVKLDTTKVQIALKVSSEWLTNITLTGNTKNLVIDESQAIQKVVDAGQMSPEGIIKIEYTIDGKEWLSKDDFMAKLVQLDGAINETKWLILREDIKARFVLNEEINNTLETPVILFVDDVLIDSNDKSTQVQLIDDAKGLNSDVKGYINANKLTPFVASNFVVRGTNTNATLEVSETDKFNAMMNPYSSNNVFKMLYASAENAFVDDQKVWIPGQGISTSTKLKGDYAQKYFAIALQSANENYVVYHNGVEQQNGYVLSTPDIQVYISTAITNPLIDQNISIQFKLDSDDKATFYQNKGSFILYVDKDGRRMNFDEFIASLSEDVMFQGEKDAVELAYYVSDHELTDVEYKEATSVEKITDYTHSDEKYGVWKSYPRNITDYKALDLGLKVNDYVIVALRVKESALSSDTNPNGYVIENDNYTPQQQQRAYGFFVDASEVNVNWNEMKLQNVGKAQSASYGLDGYAMLQRLSLTQDQGNNYLGVSLKLKYFDDFYKDSNGNILVSNQDERLVIRDTAGATNTGKFYLGLNGQPLVDANGNKIAIYENSEGLPPAPTKYSTATREIELEEIGVNSFTLNRIPFGNDVNKLASHSFFKYQTIAIEFGDKKGQAPGDEFDYYVDEVVSREYTLDSEIKFPIPNPTNITYKFNSEEFTKFINDEGNINQGLVFRNDVNPDKEPINGQATLKYMYNVIRTEKPEGSTSTTSSTLTTLEEISNQIEQDFGGKVVLKVTYTSVDGKVTTVQGLGQTVSLEQFNKLQNGDKFEISIVSADENNFIFAQQPASLIFVINGLKAQGLDDLTLLQYLRVEQKGEFNGEGSFHIYADNPNDDKDPIDIESIVPGFKFSIRVWGLDKSIKHDWTTDLASINDLVNGDWVEWRLVEASSGNPSATEFYNTVADRENSNANEGNIQYKQIYKIGNGKEEGFVNGIGSAPTDINTYPADRLVKSGFVIANLAEKPEEKAPTISFNDFVDVMNSMNFTYTGINGLGNMVTAKDITQVVVATSEVARKEWTLADLISLGYIQFYQNGSTEPFNFSQVKDEKGNIISGPGCLWNGDKIKVTYNDGTLASAYEWYAPDVYGLDAKSDSMSMLVWVGVGAASVATLGVFLFVYLFARNRKLKK